MYMNSVYVRVAWATAQQSCRILFGNNSTLVSVESVDEWDFLKIKLESFGIGATYWTSGMYDAGSRIWRWSSNDSPLMTNPPWDNGHPAAFPTGIHRILLSHTNRYTASWRTIQNSQPHRYICEMNRPPVDPITCNENDLLIVLDSSASIGSHNYKQAKLFASNLFRNVTAVNENSRIGFLIYSDAVSVMINLNNTLSAEEIIEVIISAPYLKGETATHLAIDEALRQFDLHPRNVSQNLVILTDGESIDSTLTAEAIEAAIDMGVRSMAVGISPSANQEELLIIANGNSEHVFHSDKCDELESLLSPLAQTICLIN
ncbi:Vitrin [Pseudolycoriella hygida]|uniref:Vitrin n=1 Tax=Pseudolycoriella hygida TaxID=35572 RepID=A0A9Q0S333_9DIPT|nr:Vitrin [Pseudolycoriella hygida]